MNEQTKKSITIGICAYNEGQNIQTLLQSIVTQKETHEFFIKEIIVVSDGSTDDMERKVINFPDQRISLIYFPTREGKPNRINYLMQQNKSDIMVFLDADVVLKNKSTILNLVLPMIQTENVGLVGGRCQPLRGETFVESAINNYIDARIAVEDLMDFSQTAYCIHGAIMAISKQLASEIILPTSILSDDTYFYMFTKRRGYEVKYAKNAVVFYRSPQTIMDALRQAMRHHAGTPQLYNYFLKRDVSAAYQLPRSLLLRMAFYQWISNPMGYVFLKALNYVAQKEGVYRFREMSVRWSVISSSKITKKLA